MFMLCPHRARVWLPIVPFVRFYVFFCSVTVIFFVIVAALFTVTFLLTAYACAIFL